MKKMIFLILLVGFGASAEQLMSTKDFLKSQLASYSSMAKENFKVSEALLGELKSLAENATDQQATFYYGKDENQNIAKACTMVPQKGKEGPMVLGVCFDDKGIVNAIEIIEFNEDRGQKAKERSFLDQFKGKHPAKAGLSIGSDIHGVAGATYTSEYISEAVRKASFFHEKFVSKK
ncbi:MAG: FMN-binding protein [Bdellovibrionales bacterium]